MAKPKVLDLEEVDWEYAISLAERGQPGPLRRRLLDPDRALSATARRWLADLIRTGVGKRTAGLAVRLDDEQVIQLRAAFRHYERVRASLKDAKIQLKVGDFYELLSVKYHVDIATIRDAIAGRKRFARIKGNGTRLLKQ